MIYEAFGAASASPRGQSLDALSPDTAPADLTRIWTAPEPWWRRGLFLLLALAFAGAFFAANWQYWMPANAGVDQNGYLVGGRLLAENGSMAIHPNGDPYTFVARMWIGVDLGTPAERYYPKYPIGLPLLVAAAWKLHGPILAYCISPLAMTGGLVACYLLLRQVTGVYAALLGCIVIAVSPVTVSLTNNPNSHGATFFCVTWGMFFVLSWWQRGGYARAALAGLLVGYAATIRYTEGLLILPIVLSILFAGRWRSRRFYLQAGLLLATWGLPIALLAWHNQAAFGAWTGYDPTNESTGFSLKYFQDNWETMIRQLANTGLFFIVPIGLLGLLRMLWWRLRLGLVLLAWLLPSTLLYTAYYWAPDGDGTGYMRFFLTIFPPLVMGAMWLIERVRPAGAQQPEMLAGRPGRVGLFVRRLAAPLPLGVVVAVTVLMQSTSSVEQLERGYYAGSIVQSSTQSVLHHVPAGSVVFGEDRLLHHLQFVGDYRLYNFDPFSRQSVRRLAEINPDDPHPLQAQRAAALFDLLKDKTDRQLIEAQNGLMSQALREGKQVYFVAPRTTFDRSFKRFVVRPFESEVVATWDEPGDLRALRRPRWQGWRPARPARPVRATAWVLVRLTDGPNIAS